MEYPEWAFFPRQVPSPEWVPAFLGVVRQRRSEIDSATHKRLKSDDVVAALRDPLLQDGWLIEGGKRTADKIHRPVLFGDNGVVRVKQELDGWHPDLKIVMEIESGRGVQGNAIYRDLVRASLVTDVDYLVLGVRKRYEYGERPTVQDDFATTRDMLDSVYASGRLILPFKGVLVFGW